MEKQHRFWCMFIVTAFVCAALSILTPGSISMAKKPKLAVSYKKVSLKNQKLQKDSKGNMIYSAKVQNNSKTGTIKKIQYYYQIRVLKQTKKEVTVYITPSPAATVKPTGSSLAQTAVPAGGEVTEALASVSPVSTRYPQESAPAVTELPKATATPVVTVTPKMTATPAATPKAAKKVVTTYVPETKTVVFTAKNIKSGKTSKTITCTGDYTGKLSGMKLVKVKLYAGDALYTYVAKTKKGTLTWAVKDKKGPVFSGWVGKQSIYSGNAIRVCYTDRQHTYSFKDHVTAKDARDGKVSFKVDTSKLNWNKEGIYKVYYTATDLSGNKTKAWAKVQIYKKGSAESVADEVLRSVIKNNWSDEKKLRAIYRYVKGHCSYTDTGSHTNWRKRGMDGIRYQRGDCFTYYSVARLLITRAGIPNLEVTRYPTGSGSHHWWSLVYVRGGWYHLDTTPRRRDGKFCLVTYNQLLGYSSGRTFRHRQDILPKEATKKISPNP